MARKPKQQAAIITQREIDDIIRMRDEDQASFPEIAIAMERSISSVRDAYRKKTVRPGYKHQQFYIAPWPPTSDSWNPATPVTFEDASALRLATEKRRDPKLVVSRGLTGVVYSPSRSTADICTEK